jgi:hypothetical protein
VGNIIAKLLLWLGPKGLEFGRYSIDYHFIRNWLYVNRHMGAPRAERHTPEFAKRLIAMYNQKGEVDARCAHRKARAFLYRSFIEEDIPQNPTTVSTLKVLAFKAQSLLEIQLHKSGLGWDSFWIQILKGNQKEQYSFVSDPRLVITGSLKSAPSMQDEPDQ